MSLTLLHGDHQEQSRNRLAQLIQTFRDQSLEVFRFDAGKSAPDELRAILNTQMLFGQSSAVILENVFSLKSLKKKKEFIALITGESSAEVVLWEGKALTATQLKPFVAAKANIELFKLSQSLFQLMDSLGGDPKKSLQLLDQTLQTESADFVFQMMVRQVRLLLATALGAQLKEHPFVLQKIRRQVRNFSTQQLKDWHEKLTFLDYHSKTGQLRLTLTQEIEQLLIQK
jgi:hypothetical protein